MSVLVREHALECAASRARRASGREAAKRNFYFVLSIKMLASGWRLQAGWHVKHFFTKRYVASCCIFRELFSDQRFAGVASDGFTRGIAETDDFMPVGRIVG
jgi:hypothetical protein